MITLHPYQSEVIGKYYAAIERGCQRIIVCAPTGSGKTVIGASIIGNARANGKNTLVLGHRREIVSQTSGKLLKADVPHGIIQAGSPTRPFEPVQVASIQTLWMRAMHRGAMDLPPADLLVVDECHHCPATTYSKIIGSYPNAVVLGLTATPCRGDGRGLGGIFEIIIETPQVAELIKLGFLVPTRVYAPVDPDVRGVRTVAGDYVEAELAERMDQQRLVGDIVEHWHKFGEKRKTIVFAVSVEHSIHVRDEFNKSGVRAEHIDGSTPKPERDATLARLANGDIDIVCNCMVLSEGWDQPETGCVILARPTKKMGLFRQMVGRVLRPAEGKRDAIVLDHSGAVFRHGFVEDQVAWDLDPDRRAVAPKHEQRKAAGQVSRLHECKSCGVIHIAGEACWHCGYLPQHQPRAVEFDDGELGLVDRTRHAKPNVYDPVTRERWHAMLVHIANERGYQPGWVRHQYKEKFGTWPPWGTAPMPLPPTAEVRSWVRSRMIRWAKRRA